MMRLPVPTYIDAYNASILHVGSEVQREHYYNARPQFYNRKPAARRVNGLCPCRYVHVVIGNNNT